MAHRIFSYSMQILSCGIWYLVSWSGIEPGPPALGAWGLSHWTTSEVPEIAFQLLAFGERSRQHSETELREMGAVSVLFSMHGFLSSVSSVAQSCPTLCNPVDCSTPGFPVHHQLPEPTQTHVHCVGDAIQPSHPLLSPSPPAFSLS